MFVYFALLLLGVGYAPPSDRNALEALQYRFALNTHDLLAPATSLELDEGEASYFPIAAQLYHCDAIAVRRHKDANRFLPFRSGYQCTVEITSVGYPSYQITGVFSFNNGRWQFYGDNRPGEYRPQDLLNQGGERGNARVILKPGSIPYNGFPEDPINVLAAPYKELLQPPDK